MIRAVVKVLVKVLWFLKSLRIKTVGVWKHRSFVNGEVKKVYAFR